MKQLLPSVIHTGEWHGGHIQGIAIDKKREFIYCSFTTELVKLDMKGNVIGSVRGFTGHLGCLAYHEDDGRIYGSLEYKNDEIGDGILRTLGVGQVENAFYIAIFDGDKITERDMDAEKNGVMKTVFLKDVIDDYLAEWTENGEAIRHRYGCSGIDGITFAPAFEGEGTRLYVAYGIYGDTKRTDNDHQVLLSYDPKTLFPYEEVLTSQNIHKSGPDRAEQRYFVFTGNTTYGVQNLEYDPFTGDLYLSVYRGRKSCYPNYNFYVIDGKAKPELRTLRGCGAETGKLLKLRESGMHHGPSGVYGYETRFGSTGICALGDGLYYFAEPIDSGNVHRSAIRLFRLDESSSALFAPVCE